MGLFLKLHTLLMVQDSALELGGVIEPDPVPFSFNTLGWKLVFFIALLLLCFLGYKIYKLYQKKQYVRDAILEIQTLRKQNDLSGVDFINGVLFILKSTAIHTFGRPEVAGLYGTDWVDFLDAKVKQSDFKADEAVILDAVYKHQFNETTHFNKDAFSNKSINWIKHHAR